MPTLGEVFREGRYRRNLSLEQVEADVKIRKKYLMALEEDDYAALPAPVYARGFVQIYAEYLGIDHLFAEKLYQPPDRTVVAPPIRPAATGLREVHAISMRTVVTLLATVLVIAGVAYLYAQYLAYAESPPVDAVPRSSPIATATAYAVAAPLPTATATPLPTPSPTPVRGVEVTVNVTERCWLRVIIDGQSTPVFEGELQPGDVRTWTAKDRMDMRVGNAGGVDVTVNGMRQGKLGASGEVKNVTWGKQY